MRSNHQEPLLPGGSSSDAAYTTPPHTRSRKNEVLGGDRSSSKDGGQQQWGELLRLLPIFIMSGVQQGFQFCEFPAKVLAPKLGAAGISFVMITFGVVNCVASMAWGRLVKSCKFAQLLILSSILLSCAVYIWLAAFPLTDYGWGAGAAGMLVLIDAAFNTQITMLMGSLESPAISERGFALWRGTQSLFTGIVFLAGPSVALVPEFSALAVLSGATAAYCSFLLLRNGGKGLESSA